MDLTHLIFVYIFNNLHPFLRKKSSRSQYLTHFTITPRLEKKTNTTKTHLDYVFH
jgi:hypothetical protein